MPDIGLGNVVVLGALPAACEPKSSCTSFLHTIEHSSIPGQKLSGTLHEPCNLIGRTVVIVQEMVKNLRQIFTQVSWACWHNPGNVTYLVLTVAFQCENFPPRPTNLWK